MTIQPTTAALSGAPQPFSHPLAAHWAGLKSRSPGIRARDAASELGVSEAALIASLCGATGEPRAIRLRSSRADIIKDIPALGPVMALTRNEHCVHEKTGPYLDVTVNPAHGLVLGELIDLRIFPVHWKHAFAVLEQTKDGLRRSLQIFDAAGIAVHKIFQKPATNVAAFDALIANWADADHSPEFIAGEAWQDTPDRPDAEIDIADLRQRWSALQDTHDFFTMLKAAKSGRLQALRLAGRNFAEEVETSSLPRALELAQQREVPIMVFVGNSGCIQIHSGPVKNLKRLGPWFNVLDPDFNLHLREDKIASAWIVKKPTRDGQVTSLELFDTDGFCFAQLFGARKPGKPELEAWRVIAAELPRKA